MLLRKELSLTYMEQPPAIGSSNAPVLILVHGYGSNEKDLIQLAPLLPRELRCISVRAPHILEIGMFAWFPLEFTPTGIIVDHDAAPKAAGQFKTFIQEIIDSAQPSGNKVYLMGFSQGAVMSYLTAFNNPDLLHGVIACSGQLPETLMPEPHPGLRTLPFLVMHGIYDDVLPITKGRTAKTWLEERVDDLVYREYPVGHQIDENGIELIGSWLTKRSGGNSSMPH